MFGTVSLLACLLCGDPDDIPSPGAPSTLAPKLTSPAPSHADDTLRSAEAKRVHYLMKWWESLSNAQPERSAAARQNLRMNITAELNGHAALAVEQLTGRVREADLTEQFAWKLLEDEDDLVCLEARPKDATEQLFYDAIRVWLDSKTCQLTKIQTSDRKGRMFTTWLSVERAAETTLVKFAAVTTDEIDDDKIPPAPTSTSSRNPDRAVQAAAISSISPFRRLNRNVENHGEPTDLSEVTPQLAEILAQWKANSEDLKTATIRFRFTEKINQAGIEREFDGQLFYMAPDKFKLTTKSSKGFASNPQPAATRIYLDATPAETWISTGETVLVLNDDNKTYEVLATGQTPDQSTEQGGHSVSRQLLETRMLPYFLDINVEQMRRQWSLKLQQTADIDSAVLISATPRTSALKFVYRKCTIKIDPRTWQTTVVNCISSNGVETTFTVIDLNRNSALPADCFTPDLKKRGYKLVTQQNAK